ncbi:hypothetical protein ILUMI_08327 [Ignelater luminosus]|uniref:Non-lysosomal glucosylceramidase n=1 Tax=Ignelater luminosus TaxID=2038154 RepID=A0A8K0D727_IGNLU|nr:hypothetical protein ILUMI_08327 [Ignelater luminosus]
MEQNNCIPRYGLKLKLDHVYPEKWAQKNSIRLKQLWNLLPLILRYIIYYLKHVWHGRVPIMNYVKLLNGKQIYGVPIGGIGTGSIGRGFRGEFCRYQLKPGVYEYNTVDANQFIITIKDGAGTTILQSVLSTYKKSGRSLSCWQWLLDGSKCQYTALYPRAWTEYDLSDYGVKLVCRQISPVIPHNYKDSSLPCAVFVWSIANVCNEQRTVTIAFTFKNGSGNKSDKEACCSTKSFSYLESSGVVLYNSIDKMPCAYALAAKVQDNVDISKCLFFDPNSNGELPWDQLNQNGKFDKLVKNKSDQIYGEVACGIATQVQIKPSEMKELELCLAWDMPVVGFPFTNKKYYKFYTKYFGRDNATLKIVDYAFKHYEQWETAIHDWQNPILSDDELPDWYKSAIFNESYFISDGGTVWFTLDDEEAEKLPVSDPRQKYGRFAYLEGHEYRMYNTYDVHFYASYALAMNWPHLQLSVQYDFRDSIFMEIPTHVKMWYDGHVVERKVKNSVPHDLGDPCESPFLLINGYPVHDVSEWRDLNAKFVLQVLRDYCITEKVEGVNRKQYLEDMYEACHVVMVKSMKFDTDSDGLIENSGKPDQTYDTWVMTGASAYCGGLWLAALYGMITIAQALNKTNDVKIYTILLEKAKKAFETKLWNGKYYNFDCSDNATSVMSDQLCGHWYLRSCGFKYEVFPQNNVASALNTIFENNVMSYFNGSRGAVNGYVINKGPDEFSIQSEEMWTGVTYGLAACMIQENLVQKAWKTAGGMYKTLAEHIGMAFETPEALARNNNYRSIGYMRPLSIWSMQLAWEQRKNN